MADKSDELSLLKLQVLAYPQELQTRLNLLSSEFSPVNRDIANHVEHPDKTMKAFLCSVKLFSLGQTGVQSA